MTKLSNSYFRRQIEHHFDEMDWHVVVRKRRHAYSVYWEDDHEPLARLRPTGRDDEVEVYCWENDRWERVKEIDEAQPLEEALKYITDNPADRFDDNDSDTDDGLEIDVKEINKPQIFRSVYFNLFICSMIGAAVGGIFSDLWWALVASATVATIVCSFPVIIPFRRTLPLEVAKRTVVTPFACVGGITGSAVNHGLESGHWPIVCGVIVGVSCSFMLFGGGVLAWLAGFLAGLNMGVKLLESWQIENRFGDFFLVAFVAAIGASLCYTVMSAAMRGLRADSMDAA